MMDADEIARRSAEAMWRDDEASKALGMAIRSVAPGHAVLTLTIERRHANGHGLCHGGIIFSLADSAFAFACNSYNKRAVAQHNLITYLSPGRVGSTLTATAHEVALSGRSGIYDVVVEDETGTAIAQFRGFSRTVSGALFED